MTKKSSSKRKSGKLFRSINPSVVAALIAFIGTIIAAILGSPMIVAQLQKDVTPTNTPIFTFTPTPSAEEVAADLMLHARNWNLVTSETFDLNNLKWEEGRFQSSVKEGEANFINGSYIIVLTSLDGSIIKTSTPVVRKVSSQFYLTVNVQLANIPERSISGVIFHQMGGQFYYYGIRNSQEYIVCFYSDNHCTDTIFHDIKNPDIKPQENNQLTVIAQGIEFWLYINNQYADHFIDSRLNQGNVGLVALLPGTGSTGTFEYDNFELRTP